MAKTIDHSPPFDVQFSPPDWCDPSNYPEPVTSNLHQLAWEFMRRNPVYRASYKKRCEALAKYASKSRNAATLLALAIMPPAEHKHIETRFYGAGSNIERHLLADLFDGLVEDISPVGDPSDVTSLTDSEFRDWPIGVPANPDYSYAANLLGFYPVVFMRRRSVGVPKAHFVKKLAENQIKEAARKREAIADDESFEAVFETPTPLHAYGYLFLQISLDDGDRKILNAVRHELTMARKQYPDATANRISLKTLQKYLRVYDARISCPKTPYGKIAEKISTKRDADISGLRDAFAQAVNYRDCGFLTLISNARER